MDPTGNGFITDPDGGGACSASFCSTWDQDCGGGEKCNPTDICSPGVWSSTRCVPIEIDPGQPGDECWVEEDGFTGIDSCDISTFCWNVDEATLLGRCVEMCSGSENNPVCSDPNTACLIANDGVLHLCLDGCDPLLQNCGGQGEACYPVSADSVVFVCMPTGDPIDTGILRPTACPAGSTDVAPARFPSACDEETAPCCADFCDLAEPEACGDVLNCEVWFPSLIGLDEVGICVD